LAHPVFTRTAEKEKPQPHHRPNLPLFARACFFEINRENLNGVWRRKVNSNSRLCLSRKSTTLRVLREKGGLGAIFLPLKSKEKADPRTIRPFWPANGPS
jgi:hypothetical protein